jgi:O-antigen ligase
MRTPRVANLLEQAFRKWLPQSFVEWVWWPLFALWSFLPTSKTPVFSVAGVYVTLTDLSLLCFVLVAAPLAVLYRNRHPRVLRWTFVPFSGFIVYALITSFVMGDYRRHDFAYQIFPALMAWCAMCAGFALVVSTARDKLEGLASRMGAAITGIVVIYAVVTYLQPAGLRSGFAVDPTFGIMRLGGPLAVATDLPGILLVAVSFFLVGLKGIHQTLFRVTLASIVTAGVLLCGSRGGAVALVLLVVVIITRGVRLRAKVAVLLVSFVAAAVVFQVALPDRFLNFEDPARLTTYATGLVAWTQSVWTILFGQGYGQVWPWYMHDVHLFLGESRWYQFFIDTQFGMTVYNPHSVYMNILAETGLLGLALFVVALGSQLWHGIRSVQSSGLAARLTPGLLASLVIPAFSAMLLKYFGLSATWWAFFFLMAADSSLQRQMEHAKASSVGAAQGRARPALILGAREFARRPVLKPADRRPR